MKIEFGEFHITDKHRKSIMDVLDSNWLTMGPKVKEFEEKFRKLFDYEHCVLMSSGTAADTAACMLLYERGAKAGDEVIIPALTFIATAEAVRMAGFVPVLVDVGWDMQIDVNKIKEAITPKTKAIMAVSLMGKPAKLERIREICDQYNLFFILDNCEAYGSKRLGRFSLDYVDVETTSHFNAHISFNVESGAVFTRHKNLADELTAIRSHGRTRGNYFHHQYMGGNFKPSDLHCAIGCVELDSFAEIWEKRTHNYWHLYHSLSRFRDKALMVEQDMRDTNAPHGFSLIFTKEQYCTPFLNRMAELGIHIKRNFGAINEHPAFDYLPGKFPVASYIGNNGFHFGVHQYLGEENLEYLTKSVSLVLDSL